MVALSSILVDIDALAAHHPALAQAVDLAAHCGADVKIVDVLPCVPATARHFVTAELEQELVEHRRGQLQGIARSVGAVPVTSELLRGRAADAIVQEVFRSGHGLVVRSHERDLTESPRRFGPVDMELLRHCPCPVWIIGAAHRHPSRILAAVHADPDDAVQRGLNATIFEWALLLKELAGAELTLLHAWTAFGASVLEPRMSHEDFAAYVDAARQQAETSIRTVTAPLEDRLSGTGIRVVEGEAADAIVSFVHRERIDVVVMGTVGRTGVAGLVMGNTAERVLQRLRGSVLAVKPPGFAARDEGD